MAFHTNPRGLVGSLGDVKLARDISLRMAGMSRPRVYWYWFSLKITPQVFANRSPRLESSDNLGIPEQSCFNPERVRPKVPLQGLRALLLSIPRLSLLSNLGLRLANAFGVGSK